jgi:hypothetical protein
LPKSCFAAVDRSSYRRTDGRSTLPLGFPKIGVQNLLQLSTYLRG